jgi:replicative DNA helicase
VSLDESVISHVLRKPETLRDLRRAGITEDYFVEDFQKVWRWLTKMNKQHGTVPSVDAAKVRFHDLEIRKIRGRDLPILLSELHDRKLWMDFLGTLDDASRTATSPAEVRDAMANLQQTMNGLIVRNGANNIVDLFSEEGAKRMLKDMKKRKRGGGNGIPTGFKRLDYITGGLQPGRLTVIIARPGIGKTWLNLSFVASAVMYGAKVMLFPLEMSLEDTAYRLYTIFSHKMYGPSKAMKNLDLSSGRVSTKKFRKYLDALQDRFDGMLLVADIGSMSDPYTVDRIDAEIELNGPDFAWVDYLTLLKSPVGRDGQEDHTTIKALSNGMKHTLVRHNCAGGFSAQVNRESMKVRSFLPRVEHIAYGDAIGQDADHVIPINKRPNQPDRAYYAMVKNRHGPEIGKTRLKFAVNEGDIEESEEQDEDEDDE